MNPANKQSKKEKRNYVVKTGQRRRRRYSSSSWSTNKTTSKKRKDFSRFQMFLFFLCENLEKNKDSFKVIHFFSGLLINPKQEIVSFSKHPK